MVEMPLCGKDSTTVLYAGERLKVQPSRCGQYTLNLNTLVPKLLKFPMDFLDMELPTVPGLTFLPKTLNEAMPLGLKMRIELLHEDQEPIYAGELTAAIGTL